MKFIFVAIVSLTLCACSEATRSSGEGSASDEKTSCVFSFNGMQECRKVIDGKSVVIGLQTGEVEGDERSIRAVQVEVDGAAQDLPISDDVTIIKGDRGYIQFRDINFDGLQDIAITTSFGIANLYLDYWVYETDNAHFRYVGNFPNLTPKPNEQVLTSQVRLNAESYSRQVWLWEGGELIPNE